MPASVKTTTNAAPPRPAPAEPSGRAQARGQLGQALGFRDCPAAVLDELAALGTLRTLGRGRFVARRGDAPGPVAMVVSGVIESSVLHADGHRHLMGLALPGDFMGLKTVSDDWPETHDLSAREDTVLLSVELPTFRALRAREPSLVLACERQLAFRYRLAGERMAADTGMPLDDRVAGMLRLLVELYGRQQGNRVAFDVKLSQTDLADWLGLSRQRVNFALGQLQAQGLVDLHYGSLSVTDLDGLLAKARI